MPLASVVSVTDCVVAIAVVTPSGGGKRLQLSLSGRRIAENVVLTLVGKLVSVPAVFTVILVFVPMDV